jgi:hypothetical protein
MRRIPIALIVFAAAAFAAGGAALAQEHPEHPKAKDNAKEAVSKEAVGVAVRSWVAADTKLKGGYFLVWDGEAKKPLALTLDKVHDDKLCKTDDDTWFACADFKSADGVTYDLDVFMKGTDPKHLQPAELSIHKENGKERYGWKEEGGVWKHAPAK